MGGLIVLVAVLVAATSVGLVLRWRQGRFKDAALMLTADDLGAPLGERATLVQFSTEFCANCPPTWRLLGQVAAENQGVSLVEVNASERLDLARRLNVYATPTVMVLGPDGAIASRASGQPRKSDVLAAVSSVLDPGVLGAGA
ncbi:MAG TPA: thioredoxin family protein [Trebonia sp.]|nr:thioredoxin family protein [Trebonia sp.]